MTTKRQLSVPAASHRPPSASTSVPSSSNTTLVDSSSPVLRSKTLPISPELFERAEKMARMTNELRLRKLISKADNLERDLAQLALQTKDNNAFRQQHTDRMEKLWCEVLATRARAESSSQLREEDKLDAKEYRREVTQVKVEMGKMKSLVEELASKVGTLPTLAEANAVLAAVKTQREACEAARAAVTTDCTRSDIRGRIEETIRSTRRWHMDHKTTTLADAEFIKKYLMKQSKRDPGMAVYLQRAIRKRVKARGGHMGSRRPRSLGEFCKHVSWDDVKGAVEDVLVRRVYGAVGSLSQMSQ
ncbi:hypothetical protein C2857_002254 [Epichloe festucae Fl1]|uniref:Uncharacterized protein n=1 Tax=Epichloe festucae (strain Fl1) TaxID=877507 RepID=A0A7S9KS36_EPIFF|nr:hypothetical protein C2857_002254 [Epichloe festucae Fl1]